jgi:mono/diheme cytochrome c family protein
MKKILYGIAILVGLFLLIQLLPYGRSHTNPPVVAEPLWDSPQTRALAQRACFDCHSNESVWPWYSNVAPASWLVQKDVDEARSILNFSEWKSGQGARNRRIDEVAQVVQRGSMPPSQYLLLHPNALLTTTEKASLAQGLTTSLSK